MFEFIIDRCTSVKIPSEGIEMKKKLTIIKESIPFYYSTEIAHKMSYKDYLLNILLNIGNQNPETGFFNYHIDNICKYFLENELGTAEVINTCFVDYPHNFPLNLHDHRELGYMNSNHYLKSILSNTNLEEIIQKCQQIDAQDPAINLNRRKNNRESSLKAFQLSEQNKLQEAVDLLLSLVDFDKTDYLPWFFLGKIYLFGINESGSVIDLEKAIMAFRNATYVFKPIAKSNPITPQILAELYYYLGMAQIITRNDEYYHDHKVLNLEFYQNAKHSFSHVCKYSKTMLEAKYHLARCKIHLNDFNGAISDLSDILLEDVSYSLKLINDTDFSSADDFLLQLFNNVNYKIKMENLILYDEFLLIMNTFLGLFTDTTKKLVDKVPEKINTITLLLDNIILNNDLKKSIESLKNDNQIQRVDYNDKGLRIRKVFNDKLVLKYEECYDHFGVLVHVDNYEYENNLLILVKRVDQDQKLIFTKKYLYEQGVLKKINQFDLEGLLLQTEYFNGEGKIKKKSKFIYNQEGNVITQLNYNNTSILVNEEIFDKQGIIRNRLNYQINGDLDNRENYDIKGNLKSKEFFHHGGMLENIELYSLLGNLQARVFYEPEGILVKREIYCPKTNLILQEIYYNKSGTTTQEENYYYNFSSSELVNKIVNKYDEQGNILQN